MQLHLFSIGHGTLGADAFNSLLRAAKVASAVDIRRYPGSRLHPHFNEDALSLSLREANIAYRSMPELGGRRAPLPGSENTALRNASFRGYADFMQTTEFTNALLELLMLGADRTTVMFLLGNTLVALPSATRRRRHRLIARRERDASRRRDERRTRAYSRRPQERCAAYVRWAGIMSAVTTMAAPEAAKAAGLRYVSDNRPGIRRVKRRAGFRYVGVDAKPIADETELARIRKLAIPPAYTDVWISPDPRGHLQATGRDARGRKQYRYHPRWREVRDETKFDRMIAFAKALPSIRAAVNRDLARSGLPREKVLATVVSLLESTMIRVGNEEYAKQNESYGLTTMQEEHVQISGDTVRFSFRGKSGRDHKVSIRDRKLAKIMRQVRDLPGQELFHYIDDNDEPATISSQDVNDYLRTIANDDFTAKDFRTWEGTLACALALASEQVETKSDGKARVVAAIKAVAERLGNTPAVCKKSYIHPGVIDEFLANGALQLVERKTRQAAVSSPHDLNADETRVLAFIEKLITRDENKHLGDLLAKSVRHAKKRRDG